MAYEGPHPIPVKSGGTGAATLTGVLTGNGTSAVTASTVTQHGVLLGAASNAVASTSVGSTGQVLQANTGADPTYSTATYPSTATGTGAILRADGTNWAATTATYPNTTTINQLLYSSANNTLTGLATANNGILTTGATGTPAVTALASDGQIIIGSSIGSPSAATLTAGSGISITNGHNSITVASTAASGISTINGDSGSATGSTVTFNANTNSGSSVVFSANTSTVSLKVTDSNNNTIIGSSAGNGSITGTENTMMGHLAGNALTSGGFNVGIGYQALGNVATGQDNTAIGLGAGANYSTSESSNICIGASVGGTIGESNVIRIGNQGSSTAQQNKCFIAGITGVTVSNTNLVTINTSTTQLGSMTYSTGTWTPGMAFGGSSTGITYSIQNGQYTQIGNMIIAGFVINLINKGSATGNATITGLPVSMGSNGNNFTCVIAGGGITLSTNYTVLLARGTTSATTLDMTQFGSGQTYITATNTNFSNTSGISGTIIYTTA